MSLLLEALKKAEKAKEEALRRAKGEAQPHEPHLRREHDLELLLQQLSVVGVTPADRRGEAVRESAEPVVSLSHRHRLAP